LGVKDSAIIKAIKSFKPLGHRLELVGKYRDVFFYNDVLSTTAESTVAAIDALEGKNLETLIVGGFDRGLDCEGLVRKIKNKSIKNVIYWPHTGEIIAKELKKARTKSRLIRVRNMDETVKAAFKFSTPGAVVLLSPAASSYDYYSDYREKGDEFKKLVRKK